MPLSHALAVQNLSLYLVMSGVLWHPRTKFKSKLRSHSFAHSPSFVNISAHVRYKCLSRMPCFQHPPGTTQLPDGHPRRSALVSSGRLADAAGSPDGPGQSSVDWQLLTRPWTLIYCWRCCPLRAVCLPACLAAVSCASPCASSNGSCRGLP